MIGIIIHPPLISRLIMPILLSFSGFLDRLAVEIKFNGNIDPFRDGNVSIFGWLKRPAFDCFLCGLIQCWMPTAFPNFHLIWHPVCIDERADDDGPLPSGFSRQTWVDRPG